MPRSARLDIPGLLQHVIVSGIERCDIFHERRKSPPRLRRLCAAKPPCRQNPCNSFLSGRQLFASGNTFGSSLEYCSADFHDNPSGCPADFHRKREIQCRQCVARLVIMRGAEIRRVRYHDSPVVFVPKRGMIGSSAVRELLAAARDSHRQIRQRDLIPLNRPGKALHQFQ